MTNTGCLNLRGKDGSQSSVTVRCVYLPASFFNACSSDYLRTERLFLQRPFASQMVSPVFSHFAALLLEVRNIAFLNIRFSNLAKIGTINGVRLIVWLYFLLGSLVVLAINFFFLSSGREDLVSPFNFLLVLICFLGLPICFLMRDPGSETHSKKNSIESSCKFPPEQKCPHALFFVSRDYPAGNQFQIAKQENEL